LEIARIVSGRGRKEELKEGRSVTARTISNFN
jgi:hypothetical protein